MNKLIFHDFGIAKNIFKFKLNNLLINFNNHIMNLYDYECCMINDFIYYYLRNSIDDMVFIKRLFSIYEHSINKYDIQVNADDFQKNIVNNFKNIQREIFGAIILNILLPVITDSETCYNIITNKDKIQSISYYSMSAIEDDDIILPFVYDYIDDVNDVNLFSNGKYRLFTINFGLHSLISTGYCHKEFLDWLSLLIIRMQDINYYIIYSGAGLYNDKLNNLIDAINIDRCEEFCIEEEYYKESPYLEHYLTVNKNELLKYDNIIKPWAQKNIYPKINDIAIYEIYGISEIIENKYARK